MKRIIAIFVAVVAIVMGAADACAEFRYGPTAGVLINRPRFKQDLFEVNTRIGGSAGVLAENIFPGIGIGVSIGLEYQLRNGMLHLGEREMWASQGYGNEAVQLHYVALPLHLRWKWTRLGGFEEKLAPFIYAGPTFGITAGHSKLDAFSFSGGDVSIDVGLGAEVLQHFQISGGYSFGMTYAYKANILTNFSARTYFWSVRLAYLF